MNKSDLIAQLAEKKNLPAKEAAAILNNILETMTETLAQGENIEIRGFDLFTRRVQAIDAKIERDLLIGPVNEN